MDASTRWTALCLVAAGLAAVGSCSAPPKYARVYQGNPYVHVPAAANLTPYSNLDQPLAEAVRQRLARVGVEVVDDCPGVHRLKLSIVDVNNRPGMVGLIHSGRPDMDRILHLKIEASLENARGEVLAGPAVFENTERLLTAGRGDEDPRLYERQKRKELFDELAEQVAQAFFRD